jgi:hypothetical protein
MKERPSLILNFATYIHSGVMSLFTLAGSGGHLCPIMDTFFKIYIFHFIILLYLSI